MSYTEKLLHRNPKVYVVTMENKTTWCSTHLLKDIISETKILTFDSAFPSTKWQGKGDRIFHDTPVSSYHFLVTILFYRWNCHSRMTNITHKRTKKGNKSPVTLQPIKMHSAAVAGRIKISPHFTFFLAKKEIFESSSNPHKKFQPNSPHTNFQYGPPWPKYTALIPYSLFNKKCPRWGIWIVNSPCIYNTAFDKSSWKW